MYLICSHLQLLHMLEQPAPLVRLCSHEVVVPLVLLHEQVLHIQADILAGALLLQLLKHALQVQQEVVVTLHNPVCMQVCMMHMLDALHCW